MIKTARATSVVFVTQALGQNGNGYINRADRTVTARRAASGFLLYYSVWSYGDSRVKTDSSIKSELSDNI